MLPSSSSKVGIRPPITSDTPNTSFIYIGQSLLRQLAAVKCVKGRSEMSLRLTISHAPIGFLESGGGPQAHGMIVAHADERTAVGRESQSPDDCLVEQKGADLPLTWNTPE